MRSVLLLGLAVAGGCTAHRVEDGSAPIVQGLIDLDTLPPPTDACPWSPVDTVGWRRMEIRRAGVSILVPPGYRPDREAERGETAWYRGEYGAQIAVRPLGRDSMRTSSIEDIDFVACRTIVSDQPIHVFSAGTRGYGHEYSVEASFRQRDGMWTNIRVRDVRRERLGEGLTIVLSTRRLD